MNRRSFLRGAVALAPAVILTPGLLMPVRKIWTWADQVATNTEYMTATEVLRLQREAFARMAYLIANPPLMVIKDAPFAPIRYEPMKLEFPRDIRRLIGSA